LLLSFEIFYPEIGHQPKVIMTMRTIFRLLSLLFIFYWPMECFGADGDENS